VVFPEPDQTSQFTLAASGSRQETVRELDSERAVLTDSVCVSPSATVGDQYTPKTAVGAQCLELLNQSAASLRRLSFSPSVHTQTEDPAGVKISSAVWVNETSDASLFPLNQRRVSQEGTGRAVPGDTAVTRFANSDRSSVDPTVRLDIFKPSTTASGQPKVRDRGSQSFLGYRETSSSYPSESSEDGSFHELGGINEEQSGPNGLVVQRVDTTILQPQQQQAPAQEVQPPPPPPPSPPGQQIPPGDNGGGREPSENSQSSDSESGTSESSSSSSSSTSFSDDEMATVGGKYVTVPTFSAGEGEDPDRWLERFEEAASYNNWNPERTLKNVYIALDGPAKAWGNRLKASAVRPTVWSPVAIAEAQTAADRAGNPDAPVVAPGPHGFREFFIEEFISATHHVSIGTKLSRRVQGPTESPVNYYHDVMDLCDKKNSLMSDKERLEYIFSGLEKELAKRIVRMKPRTPHDVLEELRAEEYAEKLVGMHSRVRGAEASVSAVSTPTYAAFERKATPEVKQPPRATAENSSSDVQELKSMVSQLIKTIAETRSSPGRRRQGRFLPNRNEKGEPRCYDCDNYGHMARDCPKKSKNQTVQPAASTSGSAQKPDSKKKEVSQITLAEIDQISVYDEQEDGSRRFRFQFNNVSADHRLLLKEMASKKMLETVELQEIGSCRKKKTSCLLDTGSDLTIVSPEWCEEMKAKVTPWEGPHLWMANATPADVIGMVEISVANERGRACGSALVMKLNGYELLMGNNFLRQFKSLSIRYHEKGHEIILGKKLPVEAAVISAKNFECKCCVEN